MLRRFAPLAIAACALVFPAAASAGTLTTSHTCWEQNKPALVSGSGFTPVYGLVVGGFTVYPEDDGTFADAQVAVPASTSWTPKTMTITAHDGQNPANDTSIQLNYARFGSNLPVGGKHGAVVTWKFAGFPTGSTIWLHLRRAHNGPFRTIKDLKLGKAAGPCGTLSKRMARVPVKNPPRGGDWFVQADTKARYSSNTNTYYWYKSFNLR